MQEFFSEKIGFGRYASKSVGEVFTCDRRYFDQILHRNKGFRNRYMKAFGDWSSNFAEDCAASEEIRRERVMAAVTLMGDEKVQELFDNVLEYISNQSPSCPVSNKISFRETLLGNPPPEIWNHLDLINKFWARIALPQV